MKPQPGDDCPGLQMQADDGSTVSRESQLGKRYVLYFYPKDDTPGCTAQACSLRDNFGRVMATGVEVFGVSPDSVASHVKFREKYDLPYRLLADPGHAVADAFGVWVEKKFAARPTWASSAPASSSVPMGRIEHVLARVKPMEHVDLLLDALAA